MKLRSYQKEILDIILSSSCNDIVQLDTGAGKTPIMAALAKHYECCILVAHRNTLIKQISEKLAAFEIYHDTICSPYTRNRCADSHRKHGKQYLQRGYSNYYVASIASIISHAKRGKLNIDMSKKWLIIIDEAHHVVPENQWGQLKTLFPNARIVGFTATPARMTGESLHVNNGGLFDNLVQAPSLKENSVSTLIENGYLSDFEVYAPPDMILHIDEMSGYPADEYRRLANKSHAIVMCQSIGDAYECARAFVNKGITAACINSRQPNSVISRILDKFEQEEIKVICNVDMIGEGFDMPAVSTLIIAANTSSFIRYRQWVGRILRPSPDKKISTIIDLKGMTKQHGLPDSKVVWDLLAPPVGPTVKTQVYCHACGYCFAYSLHKCPKCGELNKFEEDERNGHLYETKYNYLNINIIRHERDEARRIKAIANAKRKRETEIVSRHFDDGYGIVGATVKNIREWFIKALEKHGVEYAEINDFIESDAAADHQFWMRNFKAKDIAGPSNKAIKVFKIWKSQD